jgi:hypothetical protein
VDFVADISAMPSACGSGFIFFFGCGARINSGAKNPVCNANSANAFPEGSRQLSGSIHSMGI